MLKLKLRITVKTLLKKQKAAFDGVKLVKCPFEELSSALDVDKLRLWIKKAEKADNERREALDVYNLQMDKGWLFLFLEVLLLIVLLLVIALTLVEMRLNLLDANTLTYRIQGSLT